MSIYISNATVKPNWPSKHYMLNFLWKYSILFTSSILITYELSFDEYKREMQNIVLGITNNMEQYYSNWCTDGIATCQTLTYNGCIGVRKKQCDLQLIQPSYCLSRGTYRSSASSVNFPPGIDYNNLQHEDIHFVCSSAKLQQTFQNLSHNPKSQYSSMYFASDRGLFREFPGQYHGDDEANCDDYDPRLRPWYTSAVSGAKNIIILLDISSSIMNRSQDAITIAISLVSSLSISDNIGVIAFENQPIVIGDEQQILVKGTKENKDNLVKAINAIEFQFDKQTNFTAAFTKGLQVVNNTIAKGYSGCSVAQNIFLLITDGNPTIDNKTSPNSLIQYIDDFTKNKSSTLKRVIVFIFALGNVNTDYLRELSCYFNGIVITPTLSKQQFQSTSEAVTQLIQFYKYLSVGVKLTQPIWSQPYLDYYQNTEMVTISMPAYHTDLNTNLTTLFGVVGFDISMSYFDTFGYTFQETVLKLTGESACQKSVLDNCKLQGFRTPAFLCNEPNCTINNLNLSICLSVPPTESIYIFRDATTDISNCCGITKNQFIIIICCSIGSACVIVLLICQRKRIWNYFCNRKYIVVNASERRSKKSSNIRSSVRSNSSRQNSQNHSKVYEKIKKNTENYDQELGDSKKIFCGESAI